VSDHEGLPIVVLEAMASGVIPVAMEVRSGIRDAIVDGESGFVVPPGDSRAMAERLSVLAASTTMRAEFRLAAWASSADFTVAAMVDRYAAWLRSLAGEAIRPTHAAGPMASCRSRYPNWIRRLGLFAVRHSRAG
jgi:glycosyltransferase involved in cell wall biosynthesis